MSPLSSPPKGFQLHSLPTGPAWIRPTFRKPILTAWQKLNPKIPLRQASRRHPEHRLFPGRAPVVFLPIPSSVGIVVRPCVHGGFCGKFTRDLYFNASRASREIDRASILSEKKIPTPQIPAVLFYPVGPFWRIDIVTTYLPESRDLASFLSTRPKPADRARVFSAVRRLFQNCTRQGIRHPDLNARNILLVGSFQKNPQAWLLDVDAILLEIAAPTQVESANRNRLLRSLLKRSRCGDLGYSEKDIPALWRELFPRP